jgi:hypothetical protein
VAGYHRAVGRIGVVIAVATMATIASTAHSDHVLPTVQLAAAPRPIDDVELTLTARWRDVPQRPRLKLSVAITDELTELGNLIGTSMNALSDDILGLQFDGRKRRARLRLGTGEGQYLRFRLDSDWHFTHGRARIVAKIQLGIGDRQWNVELPDMEMAPANIYGARGVEIRIPFFERRF